MSQNRRPTHAPKKANGVQIPIRATAKQAPTIMSGSMPDASDWTTTDAHCTDMIRIDQRHGRRGLRNPASVLPANIIGTPRVKYAVLSHTSSPSVNENNTAKMNRLIHVGRKYSFNLLGDGIRDALDPRLVHAGAKSE